jgi:CheY-like chemotaxis protein
LKHHGKADLTFLSLRVIRKTACLEFGPLNTVPSPAEKPDYLSIFTAMYFQKILLIDDDAEDQEIFKTALSEVSEMLECITIADARQALHKLRQSELKAELIFLDLNMPIMTGLEFLAEIKRNKETQGIPVIMFSTTSNPATVKLTKEMGAADFITKPDRFDKLVIMLKSIIQ